MKKIEKIRTKNTFKNFFLAIMIIAGFVLFSNLNISYAEGNSNEEEMNFGGDLAAGEAMYKTLPNGEFQAVLDDETVIVRYPNGLLKTMTFPTEPPSTLSCDEEKKVRKNINWLGGMWDLATHRLVETYNYAQTVAGATWEAGKGVFTDQTYDETVANIKKTNEQNMNDIKAHANEAMSNFISTQCKFDDGKEKYDYTLTSHGTIDDEEHALDGCKPMPLKISELSTCFMCPLMNVILLACDQMGALSMNVFSKPIRLLLAVGMALFMAVKVLGHISSFIKVDGAKFWQELFTQCFKVIIAYLLLVHPTAIYDYIISPVLAASLEYGEAISPNNVSTSIIAEKYLMKDSAALLSPYVYTKLTNFLISIQTNLSVTQAVGSTLMCASSSDSIRAMHTIMNFQMFFQGLILFVISLLLSIAFAFYIIDAVANLGLLFGIMPLLIAGWPFKLTTGYSKEGLKILLTAVFTFIFISTMALIVIELVQAPFGLDAKNMIALFNQGDAKQLEAAFDMSGLEFLSLLACAMFGFQFMATVNDFANSFGGFVSPKAGTELGARGASMATGAAQKVAKPIAKYAGEKGGEIGRRGMDAIGKKLDTSGMTQKVAKTKVGKFLGIGKPKNNIGTVNFNQSKPNEQEQKPETEAPDTQTPPSGGDQTGKPVSGKDLDKKDKNRLKNALADGRKKGIKPKLNKNTKFTKNKNGTISFASEGKNYLIDKDNKLNEVKKPEE